ncbi:MAG: VWA domain-containing protein, partial [Anaerolineae bacterium]|nr:VWA domain-containing protein [Anaerolineae bacterium]
MSLSTPLGLLLLAVLPVLIYIGRPRHAYRRTRDLAALAVRCVLVVLLVLALSGLQLTRGGDALAVVFLVDASDSVGRARTDQAVQAVRGQIEQMGERTSAGIVLFGGAPAIDRPVSASTTPDSGTTIVSSTDATNLAAAVRIALAMFPAEAGKRIVILSDGVQTAGDAEQAAQLAAAAGVEIDYQPMLVSAEPDVRLVGFEAPASVGAGQQFEVVATVESDFDTDIRLEIYAGADFLEGQTYTLEAGTTSLVLGLTSQDEGFRDFTARVIPLEGDGFSQNNSLSAFTQVTGAARVLLVGEASETQALEAALTEARLVVERLTPGSLPTTSQGFAQYDSVVLANVPEFDLTDQTETALRDYVRDGGGLLVVGGPDSYAPGLYRDTPLEEVLPVEMRLSDPQRLPKLTIAYLIDRSGSMATVTDAGQSFIELAKAAIDNSLGFLQPDDIA